MPPKQILLCVAVGTLAAAASGADMIIHPGRIFVHRDKTIVPSSNHRTYNVHAVAYYEQAIIAGEGIPSDGVGGACLEYQPANSQFCDTPADCTTMPPGAFAYCYHPPGSPVWNEEYWGRGKCWWKMPEWCNKGLWDPAPQSFPVPKEPALNAIVEGPGLVKVETCLNPPKASWSDPNRSPCAGGGTTDGKESLHTYSAPVWLP